MAAVVVTRTRVGRHVQAVGGDGYVHLPKGPGMGYDIQWDYIDDNLVDPYTPTKFW